MTGGASTALAADAGTAPATQPAKTIPFGLEMYSVRNTMMADLPGTLKAVAKIGYELVEFYAPYYDWTFPQAKDVRTMCDDLGLKCWSTHNPYPAFVPGDTLNKAIELNQILGSKLLVLPSYPAFARGVSGWKRFCDQLGVVVAQVTPHGLQAGFHNHNTEWAKLDGETRIMDFMAANTPKEFVLQFDVGTCVQAGADPVAWIKANPGRIKVLHLKDWAPGTRQEEKQTRVLFGEGVTPWKEVCNAAESVGGVEWYLMEQEGSRFPEIETVQKCYDAWKAFRTKA
jgi:sugar phosphate isomerase/epimerase